MKAAAETELLEISRKLSPKKRREWLSYGRTLTTQTEKKSAVVEEDRHILETTDFDACIDTARRVEFHMDSDKPGLIMRKKLLELLRRHGESEVHN